MEYDYQKKNVYPLFNQVHIQETLQVGFLVFENLSLIFPCGRVVTSFSLELSYQGPICVPQSGETIEEYSEAIKFFNHLVLMHRSTFIYGRTNITLPPSQI